MKRRQTLLALAALPFLGGVAFAEDVPATERLPAMKSS
jgi:hypothetical protein